VLLYWEGRCFDSSGFYRHLSLERTFIFLVYWSTSCYCYNEFWRWFITSGIILSLEFVHRIILNISNLVSWTVLPPALSKNCEGNTHSSECDRLKTEAEKWLHLSDPIEWVFLLFLCLRTGKDPVLDRCFLTLKQDN